MARDFLRLVAAMLLFVLLPALGGYTIAVVLMQFGLHPVLSALAGVFTDWILIVVVLRL